MKKTIKKPGVPGEIRFDESYYKKFYFSEKTKVRGDKDLSLLVDFVLSYLAHLHIPIRKVCDVGCGLGQWGEQIRKRYPDVQYLGIEYSAYLCNKYKWHHGSVVDFTAKGKFDLVICLSVLQYLNNSDVRSAIANLARYCNGALYLEIITKKDWESHCDQRVTDGRIYKRTGEWYKKILGRYFRSLGGGLFIPKNSEVVLYELEEGF